MWADALQEHDRMAAAFSDGHRELYAAHLAGSRTLLGRTQKHVGDPHKVVKAVEHALTSKHPKRRYLCDNLSRVQWQSSPSLRT
ncbi:MAG: hypothetical protein M3O32_00325, partial [Actinomycetota bacterium]|nr:hypothetical protein [Actinomycetota bacterium]